MRRVMLLVLGICGSLWAIYLLCCSVTAGQSYTADAQNLETPFAIAGTPLVLVDRVCYDGPFIEDGSDREASNIAAILIRNTQNQIRKSAHISLSQQHGIQNYQLSMLLPGATVMVLESSGKAYSTEPYIDVAGRAKLNQQRCCDTVARITKDSKIIVMNLSGKTIEALTVFYKTLEPQSGIHVGGITYEVTVMQLRPGEQRRIDACHVASGYTQIVGIEEIN